jgi:hypothetical protein
MHRYKSYLKITNRSEQIFTGTVLLDPLSELRSLSQGEREISVAQNDSVFVAYRLIAAKDIGAGRKLSGISFSMKKRKGCWPGKPTSI